MITKPKWTVLVYMVADTGDRFYQDAMADITEMMEAQFDDRVSVVVHADAPAPWQTRTWEVKGATDVNEEEAGSPRGKNAAADVKIRKVQELDWQNKSLLEFVQATVDAYVSDYYLLVLWGHGEGIDWKQKVLGDRGLGDAAPIEGDMKRFAPGSQGVIEVGELGKSLAGLRLGDIKKENVVLGFDACLMGMVEVYGEIQPYVGWVVAANDEIPDTGWPYKEVLKLLGDDPDIQPKRLAESIVDKCAQWYSLHSPGVKVSFAACDLSKSTALLQATINLTGQLKADLNEEPIREAVREARDFAQDLQEIAYVDLYAFCSELKRQVKRKENGTDLRELNKATDEVIEIMREFVIQHRISDDYPCRYSEHSRAVSICFPESAALAGSIKGIEVDWGAYQELRFSEHTHWPQFLERFWDRRQATKTSY
jgi:hypothetical protein